MPTKAELTAALEAIPEHIRNLWADGKTPDQATILEAVAGPEAETPGYQMPISQSDLADALKVGLEDITIKEAYNGIGFLTDQGLIGVCMRDDGIEVVVDGVLTWSSTSGEFGPKPMFPTTVFDGETGEDLYTLDISGYAGGADEADQGDGLPAWLDMTYEDTEGKGFTARYTRTPAGHVTLAEASDISELTDRLDQLVEAHPDNPQVERLVGQAKTRLVQVVNTMQAISDCLFPPEAPPAGEPTPPIRRTGGK